MALVYNRKADLANLANLPSWMVNAVVQHAASLMMPTIEARAQHAALAQYALNAAINADRPVTGVGPRWGGDPGWDDYENVNRGSWLV